MAALFVAGVAVLGVAIGDITANRQTPVVHHVQHDTDPALLDAAGRLGGIIGGALREKMDSMQRQPEQPRIEDRHVSDVSSQPGTSCPVIEVTGFHDMFRSDVMEKAGKLLSKLRQHHEPAILQAEEQIAKCSGVLDVPEDALMGTEIGKLKKTLLDQVEEVRKGRTTWLSEVKILWDAFEARFHPMSSSEIKIFDAAVRRAQGPDDEQTGLSRATSMRATGVSRASSARYPCTVTGTSRSAMSPPFSTRVGSHRAGKSGSKQSSRTVRSISQFSKPQYSTAVKSHRSSNTREVTNASESFRSKASTKSESARSSSKNLGKDRTITDHPPAVTVVPASEKTRRRELIRLGSRLGWIPSAYQVALTPSTSGGARSNRLGSRH